jgi:Kef-type K+ transport system membrane component KefB
VERVAPGLGATVEQLSAVLLPVFFIVAGLSVDLRSLGADGLVALAVVVPLAILGKFVGAAGAARLVGFGPRQATAIGLLMNTRGLTELIILTIGLELGVLDTSLFTVMVIMALVTTVMAGPLLAVVYPPRIAIGDELPMDPADPDPVDPGAAGGRTGPGPGRPVRTPRTDLLPELEAAPPPGYR